jgi:uncharacterized protein (TIGR02118 family)
MVTVFFMYKSEPGRKFDMDYYLNVHGPRVEELLDPKIKGLMKSNKRHKGLSPGKPDSLPSYFMITEVTCDTLDDAYKVTNALRDLPSDMHLYADAPPIVIMCETIDP